MSLDDPSTTLQALSNSLKTLEDAFKPMIEKPIDEWIAGADHLSRARLQILLGYAVHDLIWMSLKTAGVNPEKHQERLKKYFEKLKAADKNLAVQPASNRMKLDKDAANRFISAAIGSTSSKSQNQDDSAPQGSHIRFDSGRSSDSSSSPSSSASSSSVKPRQSVKEGKKRKSDSENALEDLDDRTRHAVAPEQPRAGETKGKRQKMDPFAGYDQPKAETKDGKGSEVTKIQRKKIAKQQREESSKTLNSASASAEAAISSSTTLSRKKQKKKMRKSS